MIRALNVLVWLYFLSCIPSQAQDAKEETPRPAYIGLFVNDAPNTVKWYTEKLGFKVIRQSSTSEGFAFALLDGYGIWIEVLQTPRVIKRDDLRKAFPASEFTPGFFKLGILTDQLETRQQQFRDKGVTFRYALMPNKELEMQLFIIEDPEGNWIQFYSTPLQKR